MLEIYDLNYNRLAILTDNTLYCARNITTKKSINQVWELTFELPLDSDKWKYVINENLVKFEGEYYVIKNINYKHSRDTKKATVQCKHLSCSLAEILCGQLELIGETAQNLMNTVLQGTGWQVGNVDIPTNKYRTLQTNEQSVFSNLIKIAELFEARLQFNSQSKTVDLITTELNRNIQIRKGKNLKSVDITYDTSELITVLYPFGGTNDIGEEVNIIGVNPTGKSYIENYTYYKSLGYTDEYIQQHPELFKKEMVWRVSEYINAQDLYEDATKKLDTISKPKVKCNISGIDLSILPEHFIQQPILGEIIQIIDEDLSLNLSAQVISISKNYENPLELQIEISNEIEYNSILKNLIDSAKYIEQVITAKGEVKTNKLSGLIDIMKTKLNSTQSKWYTDEQGNLVFENSDGTSAMKLGGGIFGIANSKDANGNWNWRTFGDGNGFVADCINAGAINGDLIKGNSIKIDSLKEDVKTEINKIGDLETNVSSIQTQMNVISGEISSKVSQTEFNALGQRVSTAESNITQLSDSINLKVDKNGIISAINLSPEEIQIQSNRINLTGYVTISDLQTAGATTINGDNITTGTLTVKDGKNGAKISVQDSSSNEIVALNTAGISIKTGGLYLKDLNNKVVGSLQENSSKTYLDIDSITAGEVYASNLITINDVPDTIYVNATTGNDNNNGSSSYPLKTISEALNRVGKYITKPIIINVATGTYNEDVYIGGLYEVSASGGYLKILLNKSVINGSLVIKNNNCNVYVSGTDNSNRATFRSTGNYQALLMQGAKYVNIDFVNFDSMYLQQYAGMLYCCAGVRIRYANFVGAANTTYSIACQIVHAFIQNIATDANKKLWALDGCFVGVAGTGAHGGNYATADSIIQGTTTPTSASSAVAPPTTTMTLTKNINAVQTKSWRTTYGWRTDNNRVYQGEYGYGNHKGCIRYNRTDLDDIKNAISANDITSIKLTIKRYNGGGSSSSGTGYLYYHNYDSFPSGEPSGTYLGTVTIPAWGQTATWDLSGNSTLKTALKNGTFTGFMLYSSSGSPYCVLEDLTNCSYTLQVTYRKNI